MTTVLNTAAVMLVQARLRCCRVLLALLRRCPRAASSNCWQQYKLKSDRHSSGVNREPKGDNVTFVPPRFKVSTCRPTLSRIDTRPLSVSFLHRYRLRLSKFLVYSICELRCSPVMLEAGRWTRTMLGWASTTCNPSSEQQESLIITHSSSSCWFTRLRRLASTRPLCPVINMLISIPRTQWT